jgi:uncharacterized membrane protein
MNTDIAYAVAALVCYGLSDIIYKRVASAGIAATDFLMVQAWFLCPTVIVYAWLTGTLQFASGAWWGGLAGVFVLVGFLNYVHSLRTGSVSIIAPIFRLNFIVTSALAIGWLGEPMTAAKAIGCLLALAAGWLLLGAPQPGAARNTATSRRPLVQALVATVAMGVANFCYKLGLVYRATPETMLVAQAIVFTSLATAMTGATQRSLRPPRGVAPYSAAAAFVLLFAFLFLLHGLRHGDASVVVPIAQMGFGIAAVLGVVFFKEAVTTRKLAGLGAAATALLVLALG